MKRLPSTLTPSVELPKPRQRPKNCRRSPRLSKGMSNPESRSSPVRKRKNHQGLFGSSQPQDMSSPESKRSALKSGYQRWMDSVQPKWSPCPPKTFESHEIPWDHKGPADAISARNSQLCPFAEAYLSAVRSYTHMHRPNNNMEIPVDDKVPADVFDYAVSSRKCRRLRAEAFRSSYTYGCNNSMEQKTCIWPSGTYTCLEKSSGISWVAVHGMNSICVVTRNEALDVARLGKYLKARTQHALKLFRETLISEMEDLVDPSSEVRQKIHQSFDKPFAVVSLSPAGTNKANEEGVPEASGAVYDDKRAINFLREKIESCSAFTYSEALQMAISGFLLLLDKEELKAKDIQVCVWARGHYTVRDVWIRDAGENLVVLYQKGIETLVERLPK